MTEEEPESTAESRIRKNFLAGIFALVPLGVTVFIVSWIDEKTRAITRLVWHRDIPFVGILIAILAIYGTGMITSSLIGKFILHLLDAPLARLPIVRQIYVAWKQIALTPGGTEGTFSRVALIPDEFGVCRLLGFTSARIIEVGGDHCHCVFVPNCPNPITGRLYFVRTDQCQLIDMSTEEAFKVLLSTGNYVPPIKQITAHPPAVSVEVTSK